MKIEQTIDVPAGIDTVWKFLEDVPRVSTCLPGATLLEVIDDNTFEGTVSVKVGPIQVNYQGRVVIDERDVVTRTVRMKADGKDRKGAGAASAKIDAGLVATDAGHTRLSVVSDVHLSGRIATLGRGVQDVASKIFAEFASRMSAEISASAPPATDPSTGDSGLNPARRELTVVDESTSVPPRVVPCATADIPAPPPSADTPPAPVENPVPNAPIRAGSMFWSLLLDKLRGLFARRSRRAR
jgi:carbon monoxide dehydrogenase subunit G